MGKQVRNSICNIKYNPWMRFDCATISTGDISMKLKVGCTIPQRMHNNVSETMNHILSKVLNTKERFRIAITIKLDSRFETLHSIEWQTSDYLKGFFWGKDGVYVISN